MERQLIKIPPFVFAEAVREFWGSRNRQRTLQEQRGVYDMGGRGAVTGGKQMDGFIRIISQLMEGSGVSPFEIYTARRVTELPGYFRPTKSWDLVVAREGKLLAALELKSQVGPSFGNNFNNRTEEALGTSVDIWTAYREGLMGASPQPFLGYLLLLEAAPGSLSPVKVGEHHFKVDPTFAGASYARRYEFFCRRLVLERQYTAACFLLANPAQADLTENYLEPGEDINAAQFLQQLLRHVATV